MFREFRQINTRSSSPRVWRISVDGNIVTTQWGQLGGVIQEAKERFDGVNHGKANFITPEDNAIARANEKSRLKRWEGFREINPDTGEFLEQATEQAINFDALPQNLSFYKPDNSASARILGLAKNGKAWYSRKRNGLCFIICKSESGVQLYSRRMLTKHDNELDTNLTWNDRFPSIVNSADRIMPTNSILLGELIIDRNGEDDFKAVQSITKSLTPLSLETQRNDAWAKFYAWDVAFWNGEDLVSKVPVKDRYQLIHEVCDASIIPVEFFFSGTSVGNFSSPNEAIEFAKLKKWEGFVIVDPEGIYGDRAYNFKGKPERPGQYCAKLKPLHEDDFVVIFDPVRDYGAYSKKLKYNGGIESVSLFQYDKTGNLVYISNLTSGLTDEMRKSLANPAMYPQVWKVEYSDRSYMSQGDGSNALMFARFDSVRTDKSAEECVNLEL